MSKNSFIEIVEQFADQSKSKRLYKKAEQRYLMKSFKITNISSSEAIQSYQRLLNKYDSDELKVDCHDWYKNQRKLFIWYLICYCQQKKCAITDITDKQWEQMSPMFFNKDYLFLKFQGLSIIKNAKRHNWTQKDDELLKKYVKQINTNQWNIISKSIFFYGNQGRFISAKQCRERWFNHKCQQINKQQWSYDQDIKILKFTLQKGKKWSTLARQLNTQRTEHMVKNRFNSIINKIRKRKMENEQSLTKKAIVMLQNQHQKKNEIVEQQDQQNSQQYKQKLEQKPEREGQKQSVQIITPEIQQQQCNGKNQLKQAEVSQYNVNQLPEGDIRDKLNIVQKLEKGCITFHSDDGIAVQGGEGFPEALVFSMTPSSVKALSPAFPSTYFRDFSSYINSNHMDKQKRQDGSSLFSPACFSPGFGHPGFCISSVDYSTFLVGTNKEEKNSLSRQLSKKSSLQMIINPSQMTNQVPNQMSCQYGNSAKYQVKDQQF